MDLRQQSQRILTPSEVGYYLKNFMDHDRLLSKLLVRGEISNYRCYANGQRYFTLKDEKNCSLRCVMFNRESRSLRFEPRDGMQVIAGGRVTVFPRDGQYQLYCDRMTPEGIGDLALAFQQLKDRLYQEGLFREDHKKPKPAIPKVIALVTSPSGAAVQDMIRILGQRWPMTEVKVLPVRVQGEGAAEEIAAAIRWANRFQVADLLITGRGGGSAEDLWAFNEEVVARAIYDSEIPVISAVGHEPDVSISDFTADLRASTPSNAAELAVPDQRDVYALLKGLETRLRGGAGQRLLRERQHLERLGNTRVMTRPEIYFQDKRMLLGYQNNRLCRGLEHTAAVQARRFSRLAAALDALSPLKVLGRGYSIAQKEDGTVIGSVQDARPGEKFTLRLSDGLLACRVEERPGG